MDIENLTLKQIRELQGLLGKPAETTSPFKTGENYFIRTVTMILVGRLSV